MFRKKHKVGARPGVLSIAPDALAPKIHIIHVTPEEVSERDATDLESLRLAMTAGGYSWIDVQGFGNERLIEQIAEEFALHPLAIADVVNVPQRSKLDTFPDQLLIIVKMVSRVDNNVDSEQVSIVLGKNFVLTFQERYGDVLDPIRERLRLGKGPIRGAGPDYLAYAIFDTIIDGYYPVLEWIGDYLEELEDAAIKRPSPDLLQDLNRTRNQLTNLRRAVWPERDLINELIRNENSLISNDVRLYLRDTYDHCVQTSDVIEMYREMVGGLLGIYLSSMANRTNDVMKVLTIVATVFIPLTFIAGVYGMNFEFMPELHVRWAYPFVWAVMGGIATTMLLFFFRKGWLSPDSPPDEE